MGLYKTGLSYVKLWLEEKRKKGGRNGRQKAAEGKCVVDRKKKQEKE